MKTMYVPKAALSVDPAIQRMREMLTSSDDLVVDRDGTISRACNRPVDNAGIKDKTVPKAVLSAASVQDLINEMRNERPEGEEAPEQTQPAEDEPPLTAPKNTIVPKGILS